MPSLSRSSDLDRCAHSLQFDRSWSRVRQEILDSDQANHIQDAQHSHHAGVLQEVNALGENHGQDEGAGRDDDREGAVHVDGAFVTVRRFVHKQKDWGRESKGPHSLKKK